jgi:hypothetical protein
MCQACAPATKRYVCDPVWPADTPANAREPLAWLEARNTSGSAIVPGSRTYCTLGTHYLKALFFVGRDERLVPRHRGFDGLV